MIRLQKSKRDFLPFELNNGIVTVRINSQESGPFIIYDEARIRIVDKSILVSSLVKLNYPQDKMDAVRNNYELVRDGTAGDKTEEYTEEYNKMQAWRAYSKQLASEIINSKSNNI